LLSHFNFFYIAQLLFHIFYVMIPGRGTGRFERVAGGGGNGGLWRLLGPPGLLGFRASGSTL
jgi:hypothetical protein